MINRSEFTVEKALVLQGNHVRIWCDKLQPEAAEALKTRIKNENKALPEDATGFDVFRCDQITNAVIDLKQVNGKWVSELRA